MKNYSSKQASRNRSRDMKIHSKSTSECKEYHTKQYLKIEDARPRSNSWHTLNTHSRTKSLITDLQNICVFNTWGRSSCSNWVKSLRELNAQHVLNIGQEESCSALTDISCCRQISRDERRKNNSTHCRYPTTS